MWQPAANTSTYFGGMTCLNGQFGSCVIATNTTARRSVIPIAGTLTNITAAMNAVATGATVTDDINGSLGTVTCAYSGSAPFNCTSTGGPDTIAAGSLFEFAYNPNGTAWSQTAPSQTSAVFQSSNGQQSFIAGGATTLSNTSSVAGNSTYYNIGAALSPAATDTAVSGMITVPGKITGLYVIPNQSDNGTAPHTWTVCHNGSTACAATPTSGMFCTTNPSFPTLGCCVNIGGTGNIGGNSSAPCGSTTAITIAAGDTLSIQVNCPGPGTCAGVSWAFAMIWEPTNTNQVPLFAGGLPVNSAVWTGLSDYQIAATQIVDQLAPAAMTVSNYGACTTNAPSAATSRQVALQTGSGPGVLPTTPGSGPAVSFGPSTPCPGALSGTLLGGAFDTTHTLAVTAGQTLDSAWTVTGSPGAGGNSKVGMAVTVP